MDAMDILGGLLGGKSGGAGGLGGKILKDILIGGSRGGASQNAPSRSAGGSSTGRENSGGSRQRGVNIDKQAEALEDLLNVANDSHKNQRGGTSKANPIPTPSPNYPKSDTPFGRRDSETTSAGRSGGFQFPVEPPQKKRPPAIDPFAEDRDSQNQRALVLIRAMVNATKSDGKLSTEEQRGLFEYLGDTSQDAVRFLQNEFNQPLDVREFAWSIPLGMEEQVYTMSVASIDLDEQSEADYLKELAHGLRLAPDVCNAIHQRHNAPLIFR